MFQMCLCTTTSAVLNSQLWPFNTLPGLQIYCTTRPIPLTSTDSLHRDAPPGQVQVSSVATKSAVYRLDTTQASFLAGVSWQSCTALSLEGIGSSSTLECSRLEVLSPWLSGQIFKAISDGQQDLQGYLWV